MKGFILLMIFPFYGCCQDTLLNQFQFNEYIVPASLIIIGTSLTSSELEMNLNDFLRNNISEEYPIDDYIQYLPIVQLYVADALQVPSENHWFDQTKYLGIANLITSGFTHAGKNLIEKERPSGSLKAFPSGHTSFSFTNAAVLYEEFKNTNKLLAYSGYGIATSVGVLRMINEKHWLSDVMVGAGLGIIVTKLVYHFEPLKQWNPFRKEDNINLLPIYNQEQIGFSLSVIIN